MGEGINRKDVLATLPFNQVALPISDAKELLTAKVKYAVKKNLDALIEAQKDNPDRHNAIKFLEQLRKRYQDERPIGGYSMSNLDIHTIYNLGKTESFNKIVGQVMTDTFPTLLNCPDGGRNPKVVSVGYLLDFINMVNRKNASFDDCVSGVITAVRKNNLDPYVLGTMLDDAAQLKGTRAFHTDIYIDSREVIKFKNSFIMQANRAERASLVRGYNESTEPVVENQLGLSQN